MADKYVFSKCLPDERSFGRQLKAEWTMTDQFTADDSLERFVTLAKLAILKEREANRSDLVLGAEAGMARERAIGYTAECIAQELYKRQPPVFCPEVQARFSAVGHIIDRHIQPGYRTLNQRRALIERAEEFASFSPYHEGHDETDDDQGIAARLNSVGASNSLFKYLRARELGERRPGEPFIPFTPQQAREMTDELGYLHQVVRTQLRTKDRLFTDQSYDRIAWLPKIGREIRSLSRQLESKPADPTLARIDAEARERKERAERAISDDPFFESSSANSPVVVPEASSSQSSSRRRDGLSPDDNAF
uniref:hypothetical protein n=1 Tax=Ensifer aridi TaxID=1708715 RepID=UPI00111C0EF0